jgi:hypothetical protein
MVASAPLIMTAEVRVKLARLRAFAATRPVDVLELAEAIKSAQGDRAYRKAMTAQTVVIPGPWPFYVTFSIETGQPCGTCRHMSMSIRREDRVPHPAAVAIVAVELGFAGGIEDCAIWMENLSDGGVAINVAQPIAVVAASAA